MIKLEDIKQEMGENWFENTKSKARVKYDNSHWKARDLSRVEYINLFLQHSYEEAKRENERLHPKNSIFDMEEK